MYIVYWFNDVCKCIYFVSGDTFLILRSLTPTGFFVVRSTWYFYMFKSRKCRVLYNNCEQLTAENGNNYATPVASQKT